MPLIDAQRLGAQVEAVLRGAGTPPDIARVVSRSLVDSNLAGHDSHGIIRVAEYVEWIDRGWLVPDARPTIDTTEPPFVFVDGRSAFGQFVGVRAMEAATEAARGSVALLSIKRATHLGRLGEYAEMAAAADLVFLGLVNTGGGGVLVAPTGGIDRRLSANPIVAGAPSSKDPIVMDIATSAIAEGKLYVASESGERAPSGSIIDSEGNPTSDPAAYFGPPKGALLPMAGHKGYALSVFAELFAGALTGGETSGPGISPVSNGMFAMLLDPSHLMGADEFIEKVDGLSSWIKSSRRRPDVDEILLPGEPEARSRERRGVSGIPVPEETYRRLAETGRRVAVDIDSIT